MTRTRTVPLVGGPNARVKYNGYEFYETIKTRVDAFPEYNEDRTSVKWVRYQITIHAFVVAGDLLGSSSDSGTSPGDSTNTDDNLEDLRERLTKPGQALELEDIGFGAFVIDNVNGPEDVNFGPKPRMLTWEPIGNDKAARVVWTCDVYRPECSNGTPVLKEGIAEVKSEQSINIVEGDLIRYTCTGTIKVTANSYSSGDRKGKTWPTVVHNFFKDWKNFTVPRERNKFRIIEKEITKGTKFNEYEWRFVFEEIDAPSNRLPPGIWEITADHDIGTMPTKEGGLASFLWMNTLTMRAKLRPQFMDTRQSRLAAWFAFVVIVDNRLGHAQRTSNERSRPVISGIRMGESIYGRDVRMTVSWRMVIADLQDVFARTNFLEPPNAHKFGTDAIGNTERESPWGTKDMAIVQEDIDIPNLCKSNPSPGVGDSSARRISSVTATTSLIEPKCPPENQSWIEYRNNVRVIGNPHVAVSDIAKAVDPQGSQNATSNGKGKTTTIDSQHRTVNTNSTIVQQMGPASFRVVMKGYALRYGRPAEVPELKSLGGRKVLLVREAVDPGTIVEDGVCPVYLTVWEKVYAVERAFDKKKDLNDKEGNIQDGTTSNQKGEDNLGDDKLQNQGLVPGASNASGTIVIFAR